MFAPYQQNLNKWANTTIKLHRYLYRSLCHIYISAHIYKSYSIYSIRNINPLTIAAIVVGVQSGVLKSAFVSFHFVLFNLLLNNELFNVSKTPSIKLLHGVLKLCTN